VALTTLELLIRCGDCSY